MKSFLIMKHWQIFTVLFALFLSLILLTSCFENATMNLIAFPFFIISSFLFYLLWTYNIGNSLYEKIENKIRKPNLKLFKVSLVMPIVFFVFIIIYYLTVLFNALADQNADEFSFMFIAIILYIITFFCLVYNSCFIAKTLKTVELQKELSLNDYWVECVLIWFFIVGGAFYIQPRINKIFINKIH